MKQKSISTFARNITARTLWQKKTRRVWNKAGPVIILTLLWVVFYWEVPWLPEGQMILGQDVTDMHAHWLRFALDSLRQGELPLWNPYLFSGQPLVANPQAALFYPPTWLVAVMPITRALSLIAVLHLWLAGVGMYAWLRSEQASQMGASLGAIVFGFSGYLIVRVHGGHIGVVTTGAWLPLILWAYHRARECRAWQWTVLGGLPVALAILAGHTATFTYVALALVAYAVLGGWREEHSREAILRSLITVSGMLAVGVALAAVQVLPLWELSMRSTRQVAASYEFAARFSWPPGYLLTLLVPNFFGEPARTGYWGDGLYAEFIYYVGVLPLILALLGLRQRHRLTAFCSVLGLGALLLAFGEYGPLHRLFYRFVPLFRAMRAPARADFLFTLAAAALAGLTFTALQASSAERKRLLNPLHRSLVLAVAGGALALVVADFVAFAWGRETNPGAGRLWHQANQTTLFVFFFLLSVGALTAWRNSKLRYPEWLVLGVIVLDLWTFGSSAIQVIQVPDRATWRIVAQAVPDPQTTRVLPWGLNDVEQSGGMDFGLRSVFGYDPLVLQRYQTFIDSQPDPRARTYDLLNAGYLMTSAPQTFPEGPDAPRLMYEQDGVWVYERPNALPRAWVASQIEIVDDAHALTRLHEADFDPRTTALVDSALQCAGLSEGTGELTDQQINHVEIVRDQANRIAAQVRGAGGLLIFSEVDYPGWRATLDGQPTPLLRADYVLRALCVPPGEHQVVLVYDPPLLKWGLLITALAGLFVLGTATHLFLRGRRAERV